MSIRQWPAAERPREKLLRHGPQSLSDAELLAIFLRTGHAGHSAVDVARSLLQSFGGLRALLGASQSEFCRHPGLGPAKYAQLQAVLAMAAREEQEILQRGEALKDPASAQRLLSRQLRRRPQEVFCCLWLDSRHRLIEFDEMFHGTINGASVYPREILRRAISHNAAAVILAHNHPSGVSEPSHADRSLTEKIRQVLEPIDVRVLDHLVVGDGEICSFAQRGWL